MIAPDSIEPYIGYKALRIHDHHPSLLSPSEGNFWPHRERLEATCTGNPHQRRGWQPTTGPVITPPLQVKTPIEIGGRGGVTASSFSHIPTQVIEPELAPKVILPPPWRWSWEITTFPTPSEYCTCGIYVVDNVEDCGGYMAPPGVIAEIALWGTVIKAERGARGQYAYPQRLFCHETIREQAERVAASYGIPLVVLTPNDVYCNAPLFQLCEQGSNNSDHPAFENLLPLELQPAIGVAVAAAILASFVLALLVFLLTRML